MKDAIFGAAQMNEKVVVHPATQKKINRDERCPKCNGELDTGWECNDCGYDAMWLATAPLQSSEPK